MKKHYLLGLLFLFMSFLPVSAQLQKTNDKERVVHCYSDQVRDAELQDHPFMQQRMDSMDVAIERYLKSGQSGNLKSLNGKLLIPVVVTVVHQNGPENISDLQVTSQINALNTYYDSYGIQFCLATKKGSVNLTSINSPSGVTSSTPGIFHYYNPGLTNHNVAQQSTLTAISNALSSDKYLRIWVVKSITDSNLPPGSVIQGYSTFPQSSGAFSDGIIMDYRAFGDIATCGCSTLSSYSQLGRILVHETGHYLGLYHTFEGGCADTGSSTCAYYGDRVCDTPPVASPGNTGCPALGWNTCNETPNLPDDIHNYMDYIDETCMTGFTTGQKNRMLATLALARSVLVSTQNMAYTGINCNNQLTAFFTADAYMTCVGSTITFTANAIPGLNYTWDFGDGTFGTGVSVSHTYAAAMEPATVTLIADNGTDEISSSQLVFISTCTPVSNTESTWMFGGQNGLNFTSGLPVYDNSADVNNTMTGNIENVVSQCDASGNLLFYSDGYNIWDQNHILITTAIGGDNSSATGAIAVPDPGMSNRYLLFNTSVANGLVYSIINISGTQASVVSNNNTIVPPPGYVLQNGHLWTGEGVTAIPACENNYWLILHGKKADYEHYLLVYKVTAAGIAFHSEYQLNAFDGAYTTMEASPDGTKVLVAEFTGNSMYLCDFNAASGTFSGATDIPRSWIYGMSFSPDSRLFYAVQEQTGDIFQYDTQASNVFVSEIKIGTVLAPGMQKRLGMQMGPDNKIYISRAMTQMGVVYFPNIRSTVSQPNLCFFDNNGPLLDQQASGCGLPNIIDADYSTIFTADSLFASEVRCDTYIFGANSCAASYLWNFGDPASGANNTSTAISPDHIFSGPGTYLVTVTVNGVTLAHTIIVPENCEPCSCALNAAFDAQTDDKECVTSFNVKELANACLQDVMYTWDFGDGTSAFGTDATHSYVQPGTYNVCLTVTAVNGGQTCSDVSCQRIETTCTPPCDCKEMKPVFTYDLDEKECLYTFKGEHGGPSCLTMVEYIWDFGDGTTSIGQTAGHVFAAVGTYDVCLTVIVRNEKGDVICGEKYCERVEVKCEGRCDCKLEPYWETVGLGSCEVIFTGYSGSPCTNITSMDWYINGTGPISGQQLHHEFQVNQSYEICFVVTGQVGEEKCEAQVCNYYFYTDCYPRNTKLQVSVDEPQLTVYPNPASESFRIKLNAAAQSDASVVLKTPDGKIVGSHFYTDLSSEKEIFVPASLANGFLFIEVQSGEYRLVEKLMILR